MEEEILSEDSANDFPDGNLDFNDNVTSREDVLLHLKQTHISALKEMCVCIRGESACNTFSDLWVTESSAQSQQHEGPEHQYMDQKIRPVRFLKYTEILKPEAEGKRPHRTTLTKGIAGIGKTACVEKLIHDWAAGSILPEFDFIFMFPFRKFNMLPQRTLSLMQLIEFCYPHMQHCKEIFSSTSIKCLYIFDGLDESRQTLNFENQLACYDECESRPLESLLSNLIRGNIHPSSSVWITTRPAAMEQIPLSYIDRLTAIRGFNEQQKREYFLKKYENRLLAEKMISVMKKEKSLSCLCYLPTFCTVLSTFLEDALKSFQCQGLSDYMPIVITPVFNNFLVQILSHQQQRQADLGSTRKSTAEFMKSKQRDIINLANLAFDLLRSQTFIFNENHLRTYNIDVSLMESGICKERTMGNQNNLKNICFVHEALQEYMAALYVFLSFNGTKSNPLMTSTKPKMQQQLEKPSYFHILKQACKETIKSPSGHSDLFLRFLCGLGTSQKSLKGLMTSCEIDHNDITKITQLLKQNLQEDIAPEKCLTLIYCLIELGDNSFVVQFSKTLSTEAATYRTLSPMDYSAMALVLKMSEEKCETFNLSEHKISSIGLQRLAPVLFTFTSLKMNGSNLGDTGVKILAQVIRSQEGKLQNLELERNNLTHKCCEALAFILSNNSMLRNVNLCDNHLGDKGICLLSTVLKQPQCRIQKLNLSNNNLSDGSWEELVPVLLINQTLQELNVSNNRVGEAGLKILSAALKDSRCKLQKLGLTSNSLSQKNYKELASAIRINHMLTHLDLSSNVIQDAGINVLSVALMDPSCSIQSLRITNTKLTSTCCEKLATVLVTNQTLRELDLGMNKLGDSGAHALSTALKNPHCKLENLGLKRTLLTDGCCYGLVAALSTNQKITHLDLSENSLTDCSLSNISSLILTCSNLMVIRLEENQFTTNGQIAIKKLNLKKPDVEIFVDRDVKYFGTFL
ncbi:NACHT, LRR and PYD domains-containing protein 3-like [Hypanus sabinus]|uniref:NACHT, LRR and PYD domains-containing protein 3-like n=1 Tax=Hypanus sabinus TaxID=79690 RepID=UPI0028C4C12B|nr:NACHT, LRR and PYD domains-containing protein 3-like [Hypanus sabinus]